MDLVLVDETVALIFPPGALHGGMFAVWYLW